VAALSKNVLNISFGQGLDQKVDPWQIQAGKMLALENAVFTKAGLMQKRNGFKPLTDLLYPDALTLTTFGTDLMSVGSHLQLYNQSSARWMDRGTMQSVDLQVRPAVRTSASQTACDSVQAPGGLVCVAYTDSTGCYYQVIEARSGQVMKAATQIVGGAQPRTFLLGTNFLVTHLVTIGGNVHLQAIVLPVATLVPAATKDILSSVASLSAGYDAVLANNSLYLAAGNTVGGIHVTYLQADLVKPVSVAIASAASTIMSLAADTSGSTPNIWITAYSAGDAYSWVLDPTYLAILHGPWHVMTGITSTAITSVATAGVLTLLYQTTNVYPTTSVRSDFVSQLTCTAAGVISAPSVLKRSVGLASKAFVMADVNYVLLAYGGALQPSYFLSDLAGNIIMRLALSNGNGYMTTEVLPSVSVNGLEASFAYLYKDLISAAPPEVAGGSNIYTQNGVNLARVTFNASAYPAEIGSSLHFTGGLLWQYDGLKLVEHGFNVWPEDLWAGTPGSGSIDAGVVQYVAVYEWTDAQGLLHRSAPSLPIQVTHAPSYSVAVNVPTLRLTMKTGTNVVRIVLYRWNGTGTNADNIFHQVTSMTSPVLNDPTIDYVTITDNMTIAQSQAGAILYTTGSVLENIATPAVSALTLCHSRLFYIDAEDRNRIGYSKQVIEATPVETSDSLSFYVPPSTGVSGSTGECTVLAPMDDKLIIFKADAIYYQVGNGPDNAGNNNDFSEPQFITATVGCANPKSVVLIPDGLMFQSDKGIWLLGRDLSTNYIGAPVEDHNAAQVKAALSPPGTNQVRFTLDDGYTILYDYYWKQWGTFVNIPGISSCIYGGLHTYVTSGGKVYQENPGSYLDGGAPVLLKFTTSWLHLMGLQGYQRAYSFNILGKYLTPHFLSVSIATDYQPVPSQVTMIRPDNYNPPFGTDSPFGAGSPFGDTAAAEQWRVFLTQQKCQALQISVQEIYDPSLGVSPGAGLTLSGIALVLGGKKQYPVLKPSRSTT
jgi:hypothetical protein